MDKKPKEGFISPNILNKTTNDKIHLECDCMQRSELKGIRQPIFYSFTIDKPPSVKIFSMPDTMFHEIIEKLILTIITICLEFADRCVVDSNGEAVKFTL